MGENRLVAFHGDPAIKEKYIARVRAHRAAEHLIRGEGWDAEQAKGCAIGCTLEAYEHSRYPDELGVPEVLAHLEDRLYEGMSVELSQSWPEAFLEAVPVGADLSLVWPRFAVWLLEDECPSESGANVASNFRRLIAGETVTPKEWADAKADAKAAARADAKAAARAAAWAAWAAAAAAAAAWAAAAAADAAWAAAAAAAAAADAAAWAANAARVTCYDRQADALLELLRAAPIATEFAGNSSNPRSSKHVGREAGAEQ